MPDPWTASALQLPRLPAAPSDGALELHLAALEYALASPLVIRDRDDVRSAKHWSHLLEPFEHQVRGPGKRRPGRVRARARARWGRYTRVMDGTGMLDRLAAALTAEADVQLAVAFGSVARGEARFDSDVDVAVLTDRPLTSGRRSSLMELVVSVTGRTVDLVDLRAAGVPLLRSALTQGRVLVRKDEAAYARLVSRMVADAEDFLPLQQRLLRERRERWIR